jgi:hypothetical protein
MSGCACTQAGLYTLIYHNQRADMSFEASDPVTQSAFFPNTSVTLELAYTVLRIEEFFWPSYEERGSFRD